VVTPAVRVALDRKHLGRRPCYISALNQLFGMPRERRLCRRGLGKVSDENDPGGGMVRSKVSAQMRACLGSGHRRLGYALTIGAVLVSVVTRFRRIMTDGFKQTPNKSETARVGAQAVGDCGLYENLPAPDRWERDRPGWSERLKHWFLGQEPTLTPSYVGLVEPPATERIGVCCSGGGIRSAAFNLGALQTLQKTGTLNKAKYLAAVSGGSYIAAAFAMVARTGGPDSDDSDPALVTDDFPPFYHGSPEEQYLRNRSSYMAPGGGGRVRLMLRLALGLAVNLLFLAASTFLAAWALAMVYRWTYPALEKVPASASASDLWWQIPSALAILGLVLGLFCIVLPSRLDRTRQAFETIGLWLLGFAILFVALDKGLPELIAYLRNRGIVGTQAEASGAHGVIVPTVGGTFTGLLGAVFLELRTNASLKALQADVTWFRKLGARVQRAIGRVAVWLLGPLILAGLFLFWLLVFVSAHHISPWVVGTAALLCLFFWRFGDVTSWSLHPFYRRRLCTAFALKRVPRVPGDEFGEAVERRYDKMVPLTESGVEPDQTGRSRWPTLLVCAAANISDSGVTPPGRSVTSFTFSRGAIGGPLVGGVPTTEFEDRIGPRCRSNYSLAAAVAMSGAAISPSMGKETRPSIRFLLGLANVRLGVWVPNPRRMERWEPKHQLDAFRARDNELGTLARRLQRSKEPTDPAPSGSSTSQSDTARRRYLFPRPGPHYLIKEMLGRNSVNDTYLYVTDGGHYENLGLVELLRRGCTEVYCFDASGGTSLSNLGDAIALARSELNVEIIDFNPAALTEDKERLSRKCCALGKIVYPDGPTGVFVYVRSVVTRSAPYDVQAFRINDPAFPHHSTFDQLYTDQKFEAYRELGTHACEEAIAAVDRQR
jgi:hypothetical protein